jgi:hypothetical protein
VSPHTRLIPVASLATGVLIVAAACGEPPQPLPTSPPYASPTGVVGSGAPAGGLSTLPPTFPTAAQPTGVQPTYPTYPAQTTTAPTKSPTPTPSHAAKCSGEPTGAQILALIKGKPGIPTATLKVDSGPYCSGTWSFTTVEISGKSEDQLEPLMVVATGKGATLGLVAAGSDVCNGPVQTSAPSGIRVLACGF